MSRYRWALCVGAVLISGPIAAAVFKCTDPAGKTAYSDQPCANGARERRMEVPSEASERVGRFEPGTKLAVPDAVIKQCFDGYRILARDPTTAKVLYTSTTVPKAGIPIVVVEAVFTNRLGGPERHSLWCRLTDDLKIDEAETGKRQRDFQIDQDDVMGPDLKRLMRTR
jgi:hypothetical protein